MLDPCRASSSSSVGFAVSGCSPHSSYGDACAFGRAEAAAAAQMYRALRRSRGRDMDIAIAACAIERGARLWTLKRDDFRDMPGLELYDPA